MSDEVKVVTDTKVESSVKEAAPAPTGAPVATPKPTEPPTPKPTVAPVVPTVTKQPSFSSADKQADARLIACLGILTSRKLLTPVQMDQAQVAFYHCIIRGITVGDVDSAMGFLKAITAFIVNNNKAFLPTTAFRSFNTLKGLTVTQVTEFEVVLRILIDVAEVETRREVATSIFWENVDSKVTGPYKEILLDRLKDFLKV